MAHDLILEARAFLPTGFADVEIGLDLESGKIAAVKRSLPGSPRQRLRGKLLIPSGVDLHVHFRDPGHPAKEDFKTGTIGAARGGVGTVFDMPNTHPIVDRPSRLEEKGERVASKAVVDWGLWSTLTEGTREAARLVRESNGVKLYLAPTTGIPNPPVGDRIREWLALCESEARPVLLHAEQVGPRIARNLAEHDAQRDAGREVETVEAVAKVATAGPHVHVAHASCVDTIQASQRAEFSAAVTPHHLLLSFDEGNLGTRGKVNPPLRSAKERQRLWDSFAQGHVRILESDHAPHTLEEKARAFPEAPAGVPGIETAFPLLLRLAKLGRVDADVVIRAYSQRPAEFVGIPKGRIEAGFDADFFVIDPRRAGTVRGSELSSKCGWSPFEGWEQQVVETHYLGGEVVVEDHQFIGKSGRGRRIAPRSPPVVMKR